MSAKQNEKDLEMTRELFEFLQGRRLPKGVTVLRSHRPKLTPDQAWTVIWHLVTFYWQVADHVERCDVCGELYNTCNAGRTLDYGKAPYSFCDSCMDGEEYARKSKST